MERIVTGEGPGRDFHELVVSSNMERFSLEIVKLTCFESPGFNSTLLRVVSPGGPHDLLGSYSLTSRILDSLDHIFLNLIGKSPDTAAENGGGFKAAFVVLGGKPGDYPQTLVDWFRGVVNDNQVQIVGIEFVPAQGDIQRRGFADLSSAVELDRTSLTYQGQDYTFVAYWVPSSSFWDDAGVQAILAQGLLLGLSDAQVGYEIYLYSNGLRPDDSSEFPFPRPPKNVVY